MDAWGHLAFWASSEEDFNEKAKQPWISSENANDAEPNALSHPSWYSNA